MRFLNYMKIFENSWTILNIVLKFNDQIEWIKSLETMLLNGQKLKDRIEQIKSLKRTLYIEIMLMDYLCHFSFIR